MRLKNNIAIRSRRLYSRLNYSFDETSNRFTKWIFDRRLFDPSLARFGGVYIFLSGEGDVLYVGRATNFSDRVGKHLNYETGCNLFMDFVHSIILIKGAENYEEYYIKNLSPIFNTVSTDDRTFNDIRRTLISKYPSHRDEIIEQMVYRDRRRRGEVISEFKKFYSETDSDMIMELLSYQLDDEEETECTNY